MGAPFLNFDPTAGEAPPQAPVATPTPIDATPVPAQSATDVLRTSAFGDTGANQYARLVAAGQPPAAPLVSGVTPGLAGMVGRAAPAARPNANPIDPVANALIALGGGDPTKMDLQNQQLAASQQTSEIQREREFRENASEFYTSLVPAVFKQFPGRPDLAAGFLMRAAGSRGLTVDPSVLISLNQQMNEGSLPMGTLNKIITDPNTPSGVIVRMGANSKAANEAISAALAVDAATTKAKFAEPLAQAQLDRQKGAAQKDAKIPKLSDLQSLDSMGWAAWPVNDANGNMNIEYGPKDSVPQGITPFNPRDIEGQQAEAKTSLMTIQRAREQVASAKDTSKALLSMLDDPKFTDAKKSLGPDLTANVGGYQVGPSQFNRVWRNYKDYGGEGNTPEQNKLMEGIGYYTGTGFQAFLAGLRNQKIVEDIRVHIPQPFDTEPTIRSKIQYLNGRYDSVLKEFAAGAGSVRSLKKEAGVPVSGSPETPAPAPTADVDSILKQYGY